MDSEIVGKIKSKRRQACSIKPYDRKLSVFGKFRNSVRDLLIPSWLLRSYKKSERETAEDEYHVAQTPSSSSMAGSNIGCTPSSPSVAGSNIDCTSLSPSVARSNISCTPLSPSVAGSNIGYVGGPQLAEPYDQIGSETSVVRQMAPTLLDHKQEEHNNSCVSQYLRSFHIELPRIHLQGAHKAEQDLMRLRMSDSYINDTDEEDAEMSLVFPTILSGGDLNSTLPVFADAADKDKYESPPSIRQGKHLLTPVKGRPAFNPHSLGSPHSVMSHSSDRCHGSCSPGRQHCRGSAAEKPTPLHSSIPCQSTLSLRKHVKAHKLNTFYATTSVAAQKILETLDRLSAPLKVHRVVTPETIAAVKHMMKNSEVTVNEIAVMVFKEYSGLQNMGDSRIASVSLRHNSSEIDRSKMKIFSQQISQIKTDSDKLSEVTNNTESTLPLPKLAATSWPTIATSSIPPVGDTVPLKFTFSAPIDEKRLSFFNQIPNFADKDFKFSPPVQAITKTSAVGPEDRINIIPASAAGTPSAMVNAPVRDWCSATPKPNEAAPDIGGLKYHSECNGFGKHKDISTASDLGYSTGFSTSPSTSIRSCTVMDILSRGILHPGTDDLMAKFKSPAGSWECDSCLLINKPEANKCVACKASRPRVT